MRRTISLLFITVLLASFQCEHWTKYAKDIKINSDPNPIKLQTDSLDFVVIIECNNEHFIKMRPTLIFYVMGDSSTKELSSIQLTKPGQISRRIKQKLSSSIGWKNIGVKTKVGDKAKDESPILPFAIVIDER